MTDISTAGRPPAGWRPDPFTRGRLRWWDGEAWDPRTAPDSVYGGLAPVAANHVATARRWCGHAANAFVVDAAVGITYALTLPLVMSDFAEEARTRASYGDLASPAATGPTPAGLALNVLILVSIASLIVLACWTYKATQTAVALRRQTRRSPGWAAAGWFLPFVSLWSPYQSVRDLLPANHPIRAQVGLWWTCRMLAYITLVIPMVVSMYSVSRGLAGALIPIILAISACLLGRAIAKAIGDGFEQTARAAAAHATALA